MGRTCIIKGCSSKPFQSKEKISFHLLRMSDMLLYKHWLTAINVYNNQDVSNHSKSAVICSKHFTDDCFSKGFVKRLHSNAVPSIFPGSAEMEEVKYLIDEDDQMHLPTLYTVTIISEPDIPSTSVGTDSTEGENMKSPSTYPRNPRICYPGDIQDDLSTASKTTLIKYINVLKKDANEKRKIIKRLNAQNRRQKQRIGKLKFLNKQLKLKTEIKNKF